MKFPKITLPIVGAAVAILAGVASTFGVIWQVVVRNGNGKTAARVSEEVAPAEQTATYKLMQELFDHYQADRAFYEVFYTADGRLGYAPNGTWIDEVEGVYSTRAVGQRTSPQTPNAAWDSLSYYLEQERISLLDSHTVDHAETREWYRNLQVRSAYMCWAKDLDGQVVGQAQINFVDQTTLEGGDLDFLCETADKLGIALSVLEGS